jgi:hypothetical protein
VLKIEKMWWRVLCSVLVKRIWGSPGARYLFLLLVDVCRPSATCVSGVGLGLRSVGPTGSPFRERGAATQSLRCLSVPVS